MDLVRVVISHGIFGVDHFEVVISHGVSGMDHFEVVISHGVSGMDQVGSLMVFLVWIMSDFSSLRCFSLNMASFSSGSMITFVCDIHLILKRNWRKTGTTYKIYLCELIVQKCVSSTMMYSQHV